MSWLKELRELFSDAENDIMVVDGTPVARVGSDMRLESLERHLTAPTKLHRDLNTKSPYTAIAYALDFASESKTSRMYFDSSSRTAKIILDDHQAADQPSLCQHHIHLVMTPSREWEAWKRKNRTPMSQTDFIEFLEDRQKDVIEPKGIDLLSIISDFKEIRNIGVTKATDISNGQVQFQYRNERVSGSVEMPTELTLGLKPFDQFDGCELKARLRYRLNADDGGLKLWYELVNPDDVLDDTFERAIEKVSEETALVAYEGTV